MYKLEDEPERTIDVDAVTFDDIGLIIGDPGGSGVEVVSPEGVEDARDETGISGEVAEEMGPVPLPAMGEGELMALLADGLNRGVEPAGTVEDETTTGLEELLDTERAMGELTAGVEAAGVEEERAAVLETLPETRTGVSEIELLAEAGTGVDELKS